MLECDNHVVEKGESLETLNSDEEFKMNKRNGRIVKPYSMSLMKSTVEELPLHAVPPDFCDT